MPKLIDTPFASAAPEGLRTDIQDSIGAESNSATYLTGFPRETMQPIAEGGKPPKGSDFNGVLYDITDNLSFLAKGNHYPFNADFAAKIGGYPLNARLQLTNGDIVKSTTEGNLSDPNTNMSGWVSTVAASEIVTSKGESIQEFADQSSIGKQNLWKESNTPYPEGAIVILDDGTEAVSTVANNSVNPNSDMTGWFNKDKYIENKTLNLLDFLTASERSQYNNDYTSIDIKEALDRAVFAANSLGLKLTAFGKFRTSYTCYLYCDADFSCATIEYNNATGICLRIANIGLGVLSRKKISAPKVVNLIKNSGDNWAGTSATGIQTVNLNTCDLYIPYIQNFSIGLNEYATSDTGNCYSTITLGQIQNNKINILFSTDGSSAWVNENRHFGGRCGYLSAEGVGVAGSRQIKFEAAKNVINSNLFIGTSLEGDVPEYTVENSGTYNSLIFCRWEATTPRILYKKDTKGGTLSNTASQATRNTVQGGYQVDTIQVTKEGTGGSFLNRRIGSNTDIQTMSSTFGSRLQNLSSNTAPVFSMYATSVDIDNAGASDYSLQLSADAIQGKATSDTFPRIKLKFSNGRLYLSNGTVDDQNYMYGAAGAVYISNNFAPISNSDFSVGTSSSLWGASYIKKRMYSATVGDFFGAGSPEGVVSAGVGSTYRRTDGGSGTSFYVKESGTGSSGWTAK